MTTTLESLARSLAQQPDHATLAAFVDYLKEADGSQAMEAMQLLLEKRTNVAQAVQPPPLPDAPFTPLPQPPPLPYREDHWPRRQEYLEAWQRQRERDERILQYIPLAMVGTAAVIATTLIFLGY